MTEETRLKMLERPEGRVDFILDTDAFNEIDDQFAIAYMLKVKERLNPVAIYAAPFFNQNSKSPEDGMLRSYDEILEVTKLAGWDHPECVFKGSRTYLPDEHTPVISPAAEDLARRAMNYTSERPLYVGCIGAITNVASALLINPDIRERIVVVWAGCNGLHWESNWEFNLRQDVAAGRVVLGCGVPVVLIPANGVNDKFTLCESELRRWLLGKNAVCDRLASRTIAAANEYALGKPWSRVIWDVAVINWFMDLENRFVLDRIIPAPIPSGVPEEKCSWILGASNHSIRYVFGIYRDALMERMINYLLEY